MRGGSWQVGGCGCEVCMFVCDGGVCVCVCVSVCMFVYDNEYKCRKGREQSKRTQTHTHTHTHTHTDRLVSLLQLTACGTTHVLYLISYHGQSTAHDS